MIPEPEKTSSLPLKRQEEVAREAVGLNSWCLADGCVLAKVDGEPVLLTPSMTYLKLDPMGELIISLLITNVTKEGIVEKIVNEYDAEEGLVERDLENFIMQLKSYGIVI
jgi:hypothetical protein